NQHHQCSEYSCIKIHSLLDLPILSVVAAVGSVAFTGQSFPTDNGPQRTKRRTTSLACSFEERSVGGNSCEHLAHARSRQESRLELSAAVPMFEYQGCLSGRD